MSDKPDQTFELYKIYLATAEKVSDRRAAANTWMLSVNSAISALYGYLKMGGASVSEFEQGFWLLAIPAAGIIVCFAWAVLLASYSKLNGAKFQVLHEMEKSLPVAPFEREQKIYKAMGRRSFTGLEKWAPFAFIGLYGILLLASVIQALR
ncbi:hypothetical protein [uncultured Roseobacter sp.]|uniref:RipA family octameric membrane protein n=1 Tax=uncultured Roseobacter sp. TaxID=114847 RepID=UPI00262345B8|nr:hypothetical protein [uncultured Roseobacter sp.]